jgi:predicted component of type VI protein secretion system
MTEVNTHFAIEWIDGVFVLTDRGSSCGTIVSGTRIGGYRQGGRVELRHGDEVTVGTGRSPYVFRFSAAPAES